MPVITMNQVRRYMGLRMEFDAGKASREDGRKTLFGRTITRKSEDLYVVYSYGPHWPLYINVAGRWFGNNSKYGVTTGKHLRTAMPDAEVEWRPVAWMLEVAENGLAGAVAKRIEASRRAA